MVGSVAATPAAPPTLGNLSEGLGTQVAQKVVAQVDKDPYALTMASSTAVRSKPVGLSQSQALLGDEDAALHSPVRMIFILSTTILVVVNVWMCVHVCVLCMFLRFVLFSCDFRHVLCLLQAYRAPRSAARVRPLHLGSPMTPKPSPVSGSDTATDTLVSRRNLRKLTAITPPEPVVLDEPTSTPRRRARVHESITPVRGYPSSSPGEHPSGTPRTPSTNLKEPSAPGKPILPL